jgi:hypothetical protein
MTPGTHFLLQLALQKNQNFGAAAAEQRLPMAGTEPDRSISKS